MNAVKGFLVISVLIILCYVLSIYYSVVSFSTSCDCYFYWKYPKTCTL